jgi:hypothetical protein
MKKILLLLSIVLISFITQASLVTLNYNPSMYSYGNGGEFQAVTSDNGTFQTFCIDESRTFTPGVTYNYFISDGIYKGADKHPITIGTAWLFNEFNTGHLSDYNYGTRHCQDWRVRYSSHRHSYNSNRDGMRALP